MFFKRLSRSRSNSQSYVDNNDNYNPRDSKANSQQYDDKYQQDDDDYNQRPGSSNQRNSGAHNSNSGNGRDNGMYSAQSQQDHYATPPLSSSGNRGMTNGYQSASGSMSKSHEAAPDLLTRAFNEAVRPYTTKLEEMEDEIASLRYEIEQMQNHQKEVHAWIDKRGLRPGQSNREYTDMTRTDQDRCAPSDCSCNGCSRTT